MEQFDFEKGGSYGNKYYPPLRPLSESIVYRRGSSFTYEPGNATRYEVMFNEFDGGYGDQKLVMTLVNFRKAMIIPGNEFRMHTLDYMIEKLGILEGDCYALIPLINHYLKEWNG